MIQRNVLNLPKNFIVTQGEIILFQEMTRFREMPVLLEYVKKIDPKDLVVVLISGGGSALCSSPVDGVLPEEMQEMTEQLLACGAEIQEMECNPEASGSNQGWWFGSNCYLLLRL